MQAGKRAARRASDKPEGQNVARERVDRLLELAREFLEESEEHSKRMVLLARRLAMRHRIKLGNRLFCKGCNSLFVPGKTLKVRVEKGKVQWTCLACGKKRTIGVLGGKTRKILVSKKSFKG